MCSLKLINVYIRFQAKTILLFNVWHSTKCYNKPHLKLSPSCQCLSYLFNQLFRLELPETPAHPEIPENREGRYKFFLHSFIVVLKQELPHWLIISIMVSLTNVSKSRKSSIIHARLHIVGMTRTYKTPFFVIVWISSLNINNHIN